MIGQCYQSDVIYILILVLLAKVLVSALKAVAAAFPLEKGECRRRGEEAIDLLSLQSTAAESSVCVCVCVCVCARLCQQISPRYW